MARHRSRLMVTVGVSLVVLGAANTLVGNSKMDEYREDKQAAIAAGGESVREPFRGTESILDPSTDAQLLYESAYIKYEYYRMVRRGGHYLLGLGAAVLVMAAIRARRKAIRRSQPQPSAP